MQIRLALVIIDVIYIELYGVKGLLYKKFISILGKY
jgi:hypothetical protein